jgi:hypothetical protein
LNGIEKGEKLRVTPRILGYCGILFLLGLGLTALLLTRSDIDATLLRAPGSLFQQTPTGKISNLYLLKLTNKTHRQMPVELKLEQPEHRSPSSVASLTCRQRNKLKLRC